MRFSQIKGHPEISNNTQLCALYLYFLEDSIPDKMEWKLFLFTALQLMRLVISTIFIIPDCNEGKSIIYSSTKINQIGSATYF